MALLSKRESEASTAAPDELWGANRNTAMLWKGDLVDYDGSHCQAPPEGAQC